MIGIIVTGHGNFATGMQSSLHVIAGECANVKAVDFEQGCGVHAFEEKLQQALAEQAACYEEVIVCADLIGGTPFKSAVMLSLQNEKIHVLGGTNLGLLLEVQSSALIKDDALALAQEALETAKGSMALFRRRK